MAALIVRLSRSVQADGNQYSEYEFSLTKHWHLVPPVLNMSIAVIDVYESVSGTRVEGRVFSSPPRVILLRL